MINDTTSFKQVTLAKYSEEDSNYFEYGPFSVKRLKEIYRQNEAEFRDYQVDILRELNGFLERVLMNQVGIMGEQGWELVAVRSNRHGFWEEAHENVKNSLGEYLMLTYFFKKKL